MTWKDIRQLPRSSPHVRKASEKVRFDVFPNGIRHHIFKKSILTTIIIKKGFKIRYLLRNHLPHHLTVSIVSNWLYTTQFPLTLCLRVRNRLIICCIVLEHNNLHPGPWFVFPVAFIKEYTCIKVTQYNHSRMRGLTFCRKMSVTSYCINATPLDSRRL